MTSPEINPFKVGDRVLTPWERYPGVYAVLEIDGAQCRIDDGSTDPWWHWDNLKAAVCGVDYDTHLEVQPTGHHADGSGIQNHSCGEMYPYVTIYRDKPAGRNADGRYDVGVLGPRNQDPIWCRSFDHAVKLIETLKDTKA